MFHRHLNNLHVSTQWMLLDLQADQSKLVAMVTSLAEENAKLRKELADVSTQVAQMAKEVSEVEAKVDLKAEILLEDVNFSLVTAADDVVDRVDRNAEARDRDSMFAERVKKAKRELDSGLGLPEATSTPKKF